MYSPNTQIIIARFLRPGTELHAIYGETEYSQQFSHCMNFGMSFHVSPHNTLYWTPPVVVTSAIAEIGGYRYDNGMLHIDHVSVSPYPVYLHQTIIDRVSCALYDWPDVLKAWRLWD